MYDYLHIMKHHLYLKTTIFFALCPKSYILPTVYEHLHFDTLGWTCKGRIYCKYIFVTGEMCALTDHPRPVFCNSIKIYICKKKTGEISFGTDVSPQCSSCEFIPMDSTIVLYCFEPQYRWVYYL